MGGSSKKVTVGYRYSMGLHMGLCHEPDALLEIRVGDRRAWSGVITENTTTTIYAPNLFGGDEREGGIHGTMDVMMGRPDQAPNAYLAEHQGTPQPAYRGFLGLVYRGLIASNNPYIKNWAARVRSILRGWHGGEAWYPERAAIGMVAPQAAAIYMALDYSFSMEQPVPGGGTRMSNMKAAVTTTLDMLKNSIVDDGGVLNLRIERFGTAAEGMTWMNATAVDIEAAKAYVNGSTYLSGTSFAAAMGQLSAFYSAAGGQRIGVLVTDGEPNGLDADAQAARMLVNAISGLRMYGVNIDLADTTYTEMVNNTGAPVPVVAGDDPSALAAALADAILGGRIGMNPAHIVVQALTDPDWGMGYPMATIDQDSFRAAANALYAEGLGLSFKWNTQSSIQEFTQIVADHASLVYGQDRRTGLFRMRLLRHDYDVDDLPVFTRHDVKVIRYQRPSLADTVNELIIQYTDAMTGKDASTAPMQNLANIQGQGRVVSQTLNFPGIQTPQLAARVGMRELQARSTALWRFSLEAKRRFASLLPGEPFVLDLLDTDIGVRLVMRAGEIDYGEAADAVVRAECVEDVFAMPDTTYAGNPGSGGEAPDTSAKPGPAAVFEVPYTELVQTVPAAELAALPPDAGYVGAVALRPPGVPLNYALFTRMGVAEFDEAATGDYAPGAILAAPVTDDPEDVTLVVASGTRLQELAIGSGAFLGQGASAETVRIDAVDLEAGTITVGRGCGDTVPGQWPAGTRLWGFDVEAAADPQQYVDGETIDAKVVNRSTNGQIELADAAGGSVTVASRQARPYPPAWVRLNGEPKPTIVGSDMVFTWRHRDRKLQADTLVDGTEASVGPEAGTTYTVQVWNSDASTLITERAGVDADTVTIPIAEVSAASVIVRVFSVRDGLESWNRWEWAIEIPVVPLSFVFTDDPYTPPDGDAVDFVFES